jgi:capsular exopolysaccharide synthesis family protein
MPQAEIPKTLVPPRDPSDEGIWSLLKSARKHWAIVVATTVLAVGTALFYAKSATKIYQASTLLEIDPNPVAPLKDNKAIDMGAGDYWDTQEYYSTQYKILVSDRVLGKVARDLALTHDYEFLGYEQPPAEAPTVALASAVLRGHVIVDPIKNSRLVWVHVEDRDPKRAQRLCDAVAAAYIAQNLDTAVNSSADAALWLSGQLDHVGHQLEHDEDALHEFKRENDLPSTSINEASNMLRVEMQELDTALTQTRTKREELAARFAELSKVSPDTPDQLPASELLGNTYLQSLRKEYQEAEKERVALAAEGKGENHPQMQTAAGKAAQTKSALMAEIRNIQGALERDLAVVTRQEKGESALFEETRKRAVDLNMKEIEYHRLDRAREQNEKLYATLLEQMKESDLARMMRVNNVRVVDFASDPGGPIRPRKVVALTVGAFVGLVLGLGLALLRQRLDSSVKTPGDVEQLLGVTFLGLLPRSDDVEARSRGRRRQRVRPETPGIELIVHDKPMSGVAEAARSVRTNLMFMNPDRPYKRLLVTSAAPGEGKTTVACSIAIAFAQGGQRVCVIDCDLRRPRLHRVFGRAGESGVTNYLVGESTLDDVVKPTTVANLWSIPAGPLPPNPADLLHSARFKRLLEELSARFDRVIIDSPPVVAVTDAAILSTLVEGTVFVVRSFKTPRNLAAQGLRALHDVDASVVGVVLNAVNLSSNEYNYYYHYYYYKRDGYHSAQAPAAPDVNEGASPPN